MKSVITYWRLTPKIRYSFFAGIIIAVVLAVVLSANLFMNTRLRANDLYMTSAPTTDTIAIIAIDGASLDRYGSTPAEWSRTVYVDLIDQLIPANPRVVVFDLLFSKVEEEDQAFADALANLRQNEIRTRIVLADAGINNLTLNERITDVPAVVFETSLPLSPIIAEKVDYFGFANSFPDVDSVVRRQPSVVTVADSAGYTLSIASYLAYLRIPQMAASQVVTFDGDRLYVTPDRALPIDRFGIWKQYFYGIVATDRYSTFPAASLIDVIDGKIDTTLFTDKIVLIGLYNTPGQLDQYMVPSSADGALMPGVEIQAHAIESLIQGMFPEDMPRTWQIVLLAILSVGSSLMYALLPRWHIKLLLVIVLSVLWFFALSLVFSTTLLTINLFDTLLAIIISFVVSLGIDITVERAQRQQKEFILQSLQRIAEQRLQIDQVAFYILNDVKQIAPEASSFLFLRNNQRVEGFIGFDPHKALEQSQVSLLTEGYTHLQQPITENKQTMFPIIWQSQLSGLLLIQHPYKQQLTLERTRLLQELVSQLAPNIDNMLLYHALERQKHLLETVFVESPAGIAILDQSCRIVQYSESLSQLFDEEIDFHGKIFHNIFVGNMPDADMIAEIRTKLDEKKLFSIDEIKVGNGVARIDAAPLLNEDLWVVVIADITAMVDLSNLKTQMLRMAAHDLKNPLTRISGYTQLLNMRGTLGEDETRYLGFISSASKDMTHIINDILNLERLRSGKLNLEPTDMTQLVREVCSSHQPDVIQKSQTFVLDLPKAILEVKADVGQLSQAVTNLVGNAIKYTQDEGTIQVRLYHREDQIHFEVEDNGYGIPQGSQADMFSEFFRAKSEVTAHIQGTGLGLSLVKSVIEAHGGTIGFTSEESVGSTFFFSLPALNFGDRDE